MGVLSRLVRSLGRARAQSKGSQLEARGKLPEAYEAYRNAGNDADAARVMLARADTEPDATRRVALLRLAASCAPPGSAAHQEARQRKALLSLDLVRQRPSSALPSELRQLASDLEALDLPREAAEAYAFAGDLDGQSRLLAACGAIDALESALVKDQESRASKRLREETWKSVHDLHAIGKRVNAIQRCEAWLSEHPLDEEIAAFARMIRERLVRGGTINLLVHNEPMILAVHDHVTLGRSGATIVVPSPALSRHHLSIRRGEDGPMIEDPGSRNGTYLAGAQVRGALPVGNGLSLHLGGQLPCQIQPWGDHGVTIALPNQTITAPLGPFGVGPFLVSAVSEELVRLRTTRSDCAPLLNGLLADSTVDLALGDEFREKRNGPIVLKVVA